MVPRQQYIGNIHSFIAVMGMMEGCGGADAVIFVAYHAMAGTPNAVLDHTVSGRRVYSV